MRLALISLIAAGALSFAATLEAQAFDGCSVRPTSPLVVNVKDRGAKGDGKTDDTAAIQKAIDAVADTGGTVYVPDGVYMVVGVGARQLQLRSNMTFKLSRHAILRVIPNGKTHYAVLRINRGSDIAIVGGTLQGDRAKHKGKKGEWGMGVFVGPDAKRVTIAGVTARDMWGDGFYVRDSADIAFCSVVAIHNRRQGLSIVGASRLLVTNSVFRDTRGTRPSAGIDIEPNGPDQEVADVRIEYSKFIDNAGDGIMVAGKKGRVANIQIRHNVFEGNRPILIENAPRVHSTEICKNRYISKQVHTSEGFNTFAQPVEAVALQADCSAGRDMRFEVNRNTKKKKKKKK
jgi:hypothetical protein